MLVRISSCQLSAIVSCWPDDIGDHINWTIGGGAGLMAQDGGIQSWSNTFISSNLSTTLGLVGQGGHGACHGLTWGVDRSEECGTSKEWCNPKYILMPVHALFHLQYSNSYIFTLVTRSGGKAQYDYQLTYWVIIFIISHHILIHG